MVEIVKFGGNCEIWVEIVNICEHLETYGNIWEHLGTSWNIKEIDRNTQSYMSGWDWIGSLKHSHTRAPLCGANNLSLNVQKKAFAAQVSLALRLNIPLVLHIREAEKEGRQLLKELNVPAYWSMHRHCFRGKISTYAEYFDIIFILSVQVHGRKLNLGWRFFLAARLA